MIIGGFMSEKTELDLDISICSKENSDLTYTIIGKKNMNGILHYLLESKSSSSSIYLSEYAVKERFIVLKKSSSLDTSKPSISNLYSKITKSVNKES